MRRQGSAELASGQGATPGRLHGACHCFTNCQRWALPSSHTTLCSWKTRTPDPQNLGVPLTWSMAHGMRHWMSVLSRKICGNELLKEGAAWMAGKLIFPESEGKHFHTETHHCSGHLTQLKGQTRVGFVPITKVIIILTSEKYRKVERRKTLRSQGVLPCFLLHSAHGLWSCHTPFLTFPLGDIYTCSY